jgi:isopentenyl diphosphate isomerase/L-lactate dehydrogenase-like FMN-dependent dehydrogenase
MPLPAAPPCSSTAGFAAGSDIAKALAFGANGVLLARPIIWALAAYGADGVRTVLELLQNDLARNMGALGAVNLKALTRAMVRVHRDSRTGQLFGSANAMIEDPAATATYCVLSNM